MIENNYLNIPDFNKLEIHYWFNDESHSMDATLENKCAYEIIGIIKELAKNYNYQIVIETEALETGGLRKWLKIIKKEENKKATISTAILTALITLVLVTPLQKVTEKLVDKLFEDTELSQLQKEKLQEEIKSLKLDNDIKLLENPTIRKKKSNLYDALEKYPKIDKVSYKVQDENYKTLNNKIVFRKEFKSFILSTDELQPKEIEEANIEIISPVLKKGNYKWSGYYQGEPIYFNMKSIEFKNLVQTGKIEFKNGSSINCALVVKSKVDNDGIVKISGYDVMRVNYYFENDKPIETKEGKRHKNKTKNNSQQTDLFTYLDEENIE